MVIVRQGQHADAPVARRHDPRDVIDVDRVHPLRVGRADARQRAASLDPDVAVVDAVQLIDALVRNSHRAGQAVVVAAVHHQSPARH
ncbi:hypothetical protein D3C86_783620 [compost metagenome]